MLNGFCTSSRSSEAKILVCRGRCAIIKVSKVVKGADLIYQLCFLLAGREGRADRNGNVDKRPREEKLGGCKHVCLEWCREIRVVCGGR